MTREAYVYGWDAEPADERPSEFASSTGYSALSGYHQSADLTRRVARRQGHSGLVIMAAAVGAVFAVACVAIYVMARLMHG